MSPEHAIFAAIMTCIAGAGITLLAARFRAAAGWIAFVVTAASGSMVVLACVRVWLPGHPSGEPVTMWLMPGVGFAVRMHVDALSTVFLLLAVLIAVPAALYSIAYMRHYTDYGTGRYYPNFLLFLAAMYGLLSTTDMMWFFFLFWQLMTLPGYALIRFEHRKRQNVRAANKYLVMMQIACAATMVGAELLASRAHADGLKYDFEAVSASMPDILAAHPLLSAIAFALFLAGFGIKMGMWPFGQVWLPDAHPAAPSPVSAMLSGVMIKTGVYGLIRYFLWLVPASALPLYPLQYWGMLIAVLGTVTLFTGTMQALQQEQSKRLLAFHSIGQTGYILLGAGACMALVPAGPAMAPVATLALFGALLHVLNHGLFKGLLFLNAGSMLHATGTQDLNRMGGLMRFMPLTAVTALVASFSISGVPLLNGFVSKWTIFVAAVQGTASARYLAVCAAIAILTSALTLASFIKFFGASFFSRSSALVMECASRRRLKRGPQDAPVLRGLGRPLDPGWLMQLPQIFLALLCVLLGVAPAAGFALVGQVRAHPDPQGLPALLSDTAVRSAPPLGVELLDSARFAPLALAAVFAAAFVLAMMMSRLGQPSRRAAEPWLCGYATQAESNRYVAHHFYGEVKRYFHWLGGAGSGVPDVRRGAPHGRQP
jgi:hydrogenase-4 component B